MSDWKDFLTVEDSADLAGRLEKLLLEFQKRAAARASEQGVLLLSSDKGKKKPAAPKAPAENDEQWLARLAKAEIYRHVDVKREHGKMVQWCQVKGKKASRQRFVNWLNRIEAPMSGMSGPAEGEQSQGLPPPCNDWRERAERFRGRKHGLSWWTHTKSDPRLYDDLKSDMEAHP